MLDLFRRMSDNCAILEFEVQRVNENGPEKGGAQVIVDGATKVQLGKEFKGELIFRLG